MTSARTSASWIATFDDADHLVAATRTARAAGLTIVDAYTPYAVHGLDEAMGLARSRLTWVCFAGGLFGGSVALSFQLWTSAASWPLNVGGKPFASIPAFLPVTFELTVLAAALVSAGTFFVRSRLFPGKRVVAVPRVTDDVFALVVESNGKDAEGVLRGAGAITVANGGGDAP